jgi:hypothetical protein
VEDRDDKPARASQAEGPVLGDTPALQERASVLRDEPMLYCPVCSMRLAERKCKLVCERCGYYMSCADYY